MKYIGYMENHPTPMQPEYLIEYGAGLLVDGWIHDNMDVAIGEAVELAQECQDTFTVRRIYNGEYTTVYTAYPA